MAIYDVKKARQDLYAPTTVPTLVDVPAMGFIMVSGRGDPNTAPQYAAAIEILYGLSYAIKMSKMGADKPEGYVDFVVAPLEGLWWFEDGSFTGTVKDHKDDLSWTAMINQPDFVTAEIVATAQDRLAQKKKGLDVGRARFEQFSEGLCAQILHIGSYDDEPRSIAILDEFIASTSHRTDFADGRCHHEIYLGDPRKVSSDKLKTIIRHPVATL